MSCPIGTILRCPTADERRIEFYHSLGMTAMQIAGVMEDWLAPTAEAIARSEAIMTMLRERGISTPTMFGMSKTSIRRTVIMDKKKNV